MMIKFCPENNQVSGLEIHIWKPSPYRQPLKLWKSVSYNGLNLSFVPEVKVGLFSKHPGRAFEKRVKDRTSESDETMSRTMEQL
jgi:hypothetical protein